MGLNMEREARKLIGLKKKSGGSTWSPQGENTIRVMMFSHKVTKEDVKTGVFLKEELGKTVKEWSREITRQFGLTPNNAPVFSTPETIQEWKVLNKKDSERANKIKPQTKFALNIVD